MSECHSTAIIWLLTYREEIDEHRAWCAALIRGIGRTLGEHDEFVLHRHEASAIRNFKERSSGVPGPQPLVSLPSISHDSLEERAQTYRDGRRTRWGSLGGPQVALASP